MRILVIEDDDNKLKQVNSFLDEYASKKNILTTIVVKQSFQSGLFELLTSKYDISILDMSIPNFDISNTDDGGEPVSIGGELILNEMDRAGILTKTVILTAYEDFEGVSLSSIDEKLKHEFSNIYLGCIYYSSFESSWMNKLENILDGELM